MVYHGRYVAMVAAACEIQAAWRAHRCRRAARVREALLQRRAAACLRRGWNAREQLLLRALRLPLSAPWPAGPPLLVSQPAWQPRRRSPPYPCTADLLQRRMALLALLHHLARELPVRLEGQMTAGLRVDEQAARLLDATRRSPWASLPEHRLRFGFDANNCVFLVSEPAGRAAAQRAARHGLPRWLRNRIRVLSAQVVAEQLPGAQVFGAADAQELLRHGTHVGSQDFARPGAGGTLSAMVGGPAALSRSAVDAAVGASAGGALLLHPATTCAPRQKGMPCTAA